MHYTIQADYLCITKTILASASHQSISTRPVRPRTTSRHIHTHIHIYIYIYIYIQVSTILGAHASARGLCFALRFASAKSSASRALHVKAPDFAFAKLHACKAKQQPNRNPQLDNQNWSTWLMIDGEQGLYGKGADTYIGHLLYSVP